MLLVLQPQILCIFTCLMACVLLYVVIMKNKVPTPPHIYTPTRTPTYTHTHLHPSRIILSHSGKNQRISPIMNLFLAWIAGFPFFLLSFFLFFFLSFFLSFLSPTHSGIVNVLCTTPLWVVNSRYVVVIVDGVLCFTHFFFFRLTVQSNKPQNDTQKKVSPLFLSLSLPSPPSFAPLFASLSLPSLALSAI